MRCENELCMKDNIFSPLKKKFIGLFILKTKMVSKFHKAFETPILANTLIQFSVPVMHTLQYMTYKN